MPTLVGQRDPVVPYTNDSVLILAYERAGLPVKYQFCAGMS